MSISYLPTLYLPNTYSPAVLTHLPYTYPVLTRLPYTHIPTYLPTLHLLTYPIPTLYLPCTLSAVFSRHRRLWQVPRIPIESLGPKN